MAVVWYIQSTKEKTVNPKIFYLAKLSIKNEEKWNHYQIKAGKNYYNYICLKEMLEEFLKDKG